MATRYVIQKTKIKKIIEIKNINKYIKINTILVQKVVLVLVLERVSGDAIIFHSLHISLFSSQKYFIAQ
ncbi:MAG: hypothetical protein NMNS02_14440 [Nitrosomonas sp.]|nr:MAG: hypothetical protein NMNS02_14440 [Nitrosomonas sp.]